MLWKLGRVRKLALPFKFSDMKITKVQYSSHLRKWIIELGNGFLTKVVKQNPPYNVGDEILSVWHFDNYCNTVLR